MIVAQISDLHVRPQGVLWCDMVETNRLLTKAVDNLNGLDPAPDVVLATGDLTERGLDEEYAVATDILSRLTRPLFVIPGNHDDRENLRRAFADHAYLPQTREFLHYVIDDYPLRLIGLDSVVRGRIAGRMCDYRLAWLEARLAEAPHKPTMLFMHHPPCAIGIDPLDMFAFTGEAAMGTIVQRNPQVASIVCGHVHRPIHFRWYDTVVTTAPSTAPQFPLDLRENAPPSFNLEPPAFQIHLWRPESGLISHTSYIEAYRAYPLSLARTAEVARATKWKRA